MHHMRKYLTGFYSLMTLQVIRIKETFTKDKIS